MFVRSKKRAKYTYLMIVENKRVGGKVRQSILHSLGRLDILQKTGKLDGLLSSASHFSEKLAVLMHTTSMIWGHFITPRRRKPI